MDNCDYNSHFLFNTHMKFIDAKKIEIWVHNALKSVINNNLTQDIHIDEFIGDAYAQLSKKEIFDYCIFIINAVANCLRDQEITDPAIQIYLSIDLISEYNKLIGMPETLDLAIKLIEPHSVPEIIIYKDLNPYLIPLIEIYRAPLPFLLQVSGDIKVFYKEDRSYQDLLNGDEFRRELMFIYSKT